MTDKELALAIEREYEETGENAGTAMPPAPLNGRSHCHSQEAQNQGRNKF